jgi:heme/copper-type cytochrome/quinol oxidase subunit 2
VEARSFEYSPSVITVARGDRLTIELVATDVMHGLFIDGYDQSITAEPGQTARLTLVADREGTFRIRCSVSCGPLHPFMVGKLNVGTNWLLWRAVGVALLAAIAVVMGSRR